MSHTHCRPHNPHLFNLKPMELSRTKKQGKFRKFLRFSQESVQSDVRSIIGNNSSITVVISVLISHLHNQERVKCSCKAPAGLLPSSQDAFARGNWKQV